MPRCVHEGSQARLEMLCLQHLLQCRLQETRRIACDKEPEEHPVWQVCEDVPSKVHRIAEDAARADASLTTLSPLPTENLLENTGGLLRRP